MRNLLKKIIFYLKKPFTEYPHIYLLYTLLYCLPYVIANVWSKGFSLKFIIWEFLHDFIICYFTILFVCLLPKRCQNISVGILLTLLLINIFTESSCLIGIHSCFTTDMVSIIMATNIGESKEFISTYFSFKVVIVWVSVILLFITVLKQKALLNKVVAYIADLLLLVICFSLIYLEYKGTESYNPKIYGKISAFLNFETPPNLRPYQELYKFTSEADKTPKYIILIVGESYNRYHSSLYGYEKETNPKLMRLQKDSLLYVYDNVESPALNTLESFKRIMSTYSDALSDSLEWYECPALPTIMSDCGYETVWISNQSPTGVYDNIATRYSELCDTSIFVGSIVKGIHKKDLDEGLLVPLNSYNFSDNKKYFIVLHLMGSHYKFSERYPKDMSHFCCEDYESYPIMQREVRASYDNSVLYNDFVVSEILKFLEDKEALALYFSDHALDIYQSSSDYFGHALTSDSISMNAGRQIPFMMYISELMKSQFLNEVIELDSLFASGFNTEDLVNALMSVLAINEQ